jgi:K+-sensing histidine kinase KdpD
MDDIRPLDFSDVLASTIHDTKNSLGMLYNTLDAMIGHCQAQGCTAQNDLFLLQYEIRRLNHNFIRLLALYKAKKTTFAINMDYHSVYDCLEEAILENEPLLSSRGIDIELDCPADLFWAFDRDMIMGILDNILNNAYRYTKDRLKMSAGGDQDFLAIHLEDNGSGYPASLTIDGQNPGKLDPSVSFLTGSTGLGIYFSMLAAKSHMRDGRKGFIKAMNGGVFGGGIFSLYLP